MTVRLEYAVALQAIRLARLAVKNEIKMKGEKVSYYLAEDITRIARDWLKHHPELYVEASKIVHKPNGESNV